MRWPATGLSNPPLSKSTPRRATSIPHVLCVAPAGLRLVLHAADQSAAIGKDREAAALHVRDEHAARSTRRPESRQAIRDRLHVDRAVMDRIEGYRIAPAERSQDLRPFRAQVLTFPLDASRTIGAAPDVNPLDVRMPSVDHEEDPGWGLAEEQPKRLARLDRPHHAEAALKMPAVSHVGRLPGGGAFGLKQRKHAVTGVRIANAIPYVAMAPPYTNGTFASIAASLSKNRVSRLSGPSTTMAVSRRRSRTVAEWTSFESGSISICEFTERRRSAAASAFGRSTSDSEYSD